LDAGVSGKYFPNGKLDTGATKLKLVRGVVVRAEITERMSLDDERILVLAIYIYFDKILCEDLTFFTLIGLSRIMRF